MSLSDFGSLSLPRVSTADFMMVAVMCLFSASRSPSDKAPKALNLLDRFSSNCTDFVESS